MCEHKEKKQEISKKRGKIKNQKFAKALKH